MSDDLFNLARGETTHSLPVEVKVQEESQEWAILLVNQTLHLLAGLWVHLVII